MKRLIPLLLICTLVLCQNVLAKPVVRVIYFKPANVDNPQEDRLNYLRSVIETTENFYAREMERYGYGAKTFFTERDWKGDIVIRIAKGEKSAREYNDKVNSVLVDLLKSVKLQRETNNEIRIVFIGGLKKFGVGAKMANRCSEQCFRWCMIPADVNAYMHFYVAHELGHAFGLDHSADRSDIMFGLVRSDKATSNLKKVIVGVEDSKILDAHPHFQKDSFSVDIINKVSVVWAELKIK